MNLETAIAEAVAAALRDQLPEIVAELVAQQSDDRERLFSSAELGRRLGVSARTIYTLRQQGLPTVMVGA